MFKVAKKDYKYVPVKNLCFIVIDLNYITNCDLAQKTYNDLTSRDFEGKIVRVTIKCTSEQLQNIDLEYLKRCFEKAYDVNEIVPIIINSKKARNEEIKPELTDKEAIEKFLADTGRKDKTELVQLFESEVLHVVQSRK